MDLIDSFKGRSLLADDMGLGKTFQFIRYAYDRDLFPAIVLCPAAVKYNWEIEIRKHVGLSAQVLSGRKPPKKPKADPPPFTIINYDILDGLSLIHI